MTGQFIVTKEHRRFTEFANVVRKERTIGICYGSAGVGKTASARRYAEWDKVGAFIDERGSRRDSDAKTYAIASRTRTVLYTPDVLSSPRQLDQQISHLTVLVGHCINEHNKLKGKQHDPRHGLLVELIIIDEAERLSAKALELVRDDHDRTDIAAIFIGMPGIEKRFSHYPQLYSRLGFAHEYRALGTDELLFILQRHWKRLGQNLDPDDFTDAQAIAAIERITRGNFRLLERLFPQIRRILKINQLDTITHEVIETAASTLIIGT